MAISNLVISSIKSNDTKSLTCKEFSLNLDEVILYTIYFPDFIEIKNDLINFLNPTELKRAKRFHKEIDKNRFIISRSILKCILAAYTKLEVKKIELDYHVNKKPYLASHPSVCFNISHSENYAVIAISNTEVGIDIEYIDDDFDFTNLLSDIFSEKEIWSILNATNKSQAFYTSWTRKEAFVKGVGKGIDDDFKNIPCLDGSHSLDATILKNALNWQVNSFELADHYLGAVAFESLPKISKNLVCYAMPNTIKALMEIAKSI
jgi:4'-phosphopantetheinyl transferase